MYDFHDEGAVHAFDFTIFPVQGPFRLGASVEAGMRNAGPEPDLILRSYMSIGVQRPARITPFVVLTAGVGTASQKRFHINQWHLLGSLGLDAGAELRIGSHFRLTGSLGAQRVLLSGVQFDSFSARFGMGF